MLSIQIYDGKQANEIADLFYSAVHHISPEIYNKKQQDAWAPPPDYEFWKARLEQKQPFVALINNRVAGFIELDADGHIDCAYTHPDFQRQGVASQLYQYLLEQAYEQKLNRLYVEASLVAKPFFEKQGFTTVQQNKVNRNGEILINFSMEKWI